MIKDRHTQRCTTGGGALRPFVVTSLNTRRYAGSEKQPGISPRAPAKERPSILPGAPPKYIQRPGTLPPVTLKAELGRGSTKPVPVAGRHETENAKGAAPLRAVPHRGRPVPRRTFGSRVAENPKEGKTTSRRTVPARLTALGTVHDFVPRPSCVPRSLISPSSTGTTPDFKRRQGVTFEASTTWSLDGHLDDDHSDPFIDTTAVGAVECARTVIKNARENFPVTPTGEKRLTLRPIEFSMDDWSPPPSPSPPSFRPRNWKIGIDMHVETSTTMFNDETSFTGTRIDNSFEASKSVSASSVSSSSATVISALQSPTKCIARPDNALKITIPMGNSSVEASPAVCAATITSPSGNGASSVATLTHMLGKHPAGSPIVDAGRRSRLAFRSAVGIARTFFPPARSASRSGNKTIALKTMGTEVPRIRKLFVPALDKEMEVSKDPITVMEIEMLRLQKKVAGGGVVNPCLDRLGSLAAMAIVTRLGTTCASHV